ncbi:MAG: DUF3303 domain-containing protein [Terracidiphilus sp.]
MLFHVSWEYIDMSDTAQKRSMELFAKWQPGPGQFQAFYDFADRNGGFALIEAGSASDLAKTMAPWTPFLKFSARPILPIQESVEIDQAAADWRDSQ